MEREREGGGGGGEREEERGRGEKWTAGIQTCCSKWEEREVICCCEYHRVHTYMPYNHGSSIIF